MHRICMHCGVIVTCLLISQLAAGAAGRPTTQSGVDIDELYRLLCFASKMPFSSAIVEDDEWVENGPVSVDPEATMVRYKEELWSSLENGLRSANEKGRDELRKEYGTDDPRGILAHRAFQAKAKPYIDRKLAELRDQLARQSHGTQVGRRSLWKVSYGKGIRREDGPQTGVQMDVTRSIRTVNARQAKTYYAGHHYALVSKGMAEDDLAFYNVLDQPNIMAAGHPMVEEIWSRDDLRAVEVTTTGEGRAFKVTFERRNPDGSPVQTYIVWALPDRGYLTARQEQYYAGGLVERCEFGAFTEVEPGIWYPRRQVSERYEPAVVPADTLGRMARGEVQVGADELASQRPARPKRTLRRDITRIQINVLLDISEFDQTFPEGTTIGDARVGGGKDPILSYTLGPSAPNAVAERLDAETSAAPAVAQQPAGSNAALRPSDSVRSAASTEKRTSDSASLWAISGIALIAAATAFYVLHVVRRRHSAS